MRLAASLSYFRTPEAVEYTDHNANDSCPGKCALCPVKLQAVTDLQIPPTNSVSIRLVHSSVPDRLSVSALDSPLNRL